MTEQEKPDPKQPVELAPRLATQFVTKYQVASNVRIDVLDLPPEAANKESAEAKQERAAKQAAATAALLAEYNTEYAKLSPDVQRAVVENFVDRFTAGLDELFEVVGAEAYFASGDPKSMGVDWRTIEEITPEERTAIDAALLNRLGLGTTEALQAHELPSLSYTTIATGNAQGKPRVEGEIKVTVYSSDVKGVIVERWHYPDGQVRTITRPEQEKPWQQKPASS